MVRYVLSYLEKIIYLKTKSIFSTQTIFITRLKRMDDLHIDDSEDEEGEVNCNLLRGKIRWPHCPGNKEDLFF